MLPVVYFDQGTHAWACVRMFKNDRKHKKMMIKVSFPSCVREAHVRPMKKNDKNPNEQPDFGCQPAFGSHSQSLTNKLFSLFFFMRLTWASHMHDGKGTFFHHFPMFSVDINHANACTSMRSLVEIHNS